MERLTYREGDKAYTDSQISSTLVYAKTNDKMFPYKPDHDIFSGDPIGRLAAYEDSGLEPNEIKALVERESAAVADLESCRLDHVRTCANYQKCFDKAKEEFRMTPCMSKNCPGWEWRGPQPPKGNEI
jgi:hypothetical protein